MTKHKVVILGGGISGLLAAWAFRRHGPLLLEASGEVGGAYLDGGLKYIHHTDNMMRLVKELGLTATIDRPFGCMAINRVLRNHPEYLLSLADDERQAIQKAHWLKTRGAASLELARKQQWLDRCMNDPLGGRGMSITVDQVSFIKKLADSAVASGCRIDTNSLVMDVSADGTVSLRKDGVVFQHQGDLVIATLPLAILSRAAPWAKLPVPSYNPLTVLGVVWESDFTPLPGAGPLPDYIYTPQHRYTSRLSSVAQGAHWQFELPGDIRAGYLPPEAMLSGYKGAKVFGQRVIPGHLLPMKSPVKWPSKWLPLGRYAVWDSRATADKVLDAALDAEALIFGV